MVLCYPSVPLFADPSYDSEQVDEMLFGDEYEILNFSKGFVRIHTDYGYEGYLDAEYALNIHCERANFAVTSPFCDVLPEPKNFYCSKTVLPHGAKIFIKNFSDNPRYALLAFGETEGYVHKNHIKPIVPQGFCRASDVREAIVKTAESYLGTQYRWGGRTHAGIDCSGLCFNSYRFCGINIWRDADISKSPSLRRINLSEAVRGDLVFFKGHIALYLGEGKIIHSTASAGCVKIENLFENESLQKIYITCGTAY